MSCIKDKMKFTLKQYLLNIKFTLKIIQSDYQILTKKSFDRIKDKLIYRLP